MAFVSVALRFRVKGGAFLMSPGADLLTPNGIWGSKSAYCIVAHKIHRVVNCIIYIVVSYVGSSLI